MINFLLSYVSFHSHCDVEFLICMFELCSGARLSVGKILVFMIRTLIPMVPDHHCPPIELTFWPKVYSPG